MRHVARLIAVFACCPLLFGGSLTLTVKDPAGALVAGSGVKVTGPAAPTAEKTTDLQGRVVFDRLPAGSYSVSATKPGFEPWSDSVNVTDRPVELAVALKLSGLSTSMRVSGGRSPLANSDPNYIALRTGRLNTVYRVSDFTLTRDVGVFTFRSGSFSFLPPVLGHVTTGVFVGDGNFRMTPAFDLAAKALTRVSGADSVNEDFTEMVIYFSDSTFDEIRQHSELADEAPSRHEQALKRVNEILRTRRDPPHPYETGFGMTSRPMTLLERLLNWDDIPNYEAEILAGLYNGPQNASFRALVHGKKHPDVRFFVNPRGAMPTLPAPEEVALLNYEPSSGSDGIWYLSHLATELNAGRASSNEDKRLIAPEHYKIDSLIRKENLVGNHPDLAVACDLRFRALDDGIRMVKFDLVPDAQVARVSWNGSDIPFVQENRNHDGSFYLQMPEALKKDRTYDIIFEYTAAEILQGTKLGALVVPTRRVWYPMPLGSANRATYDLIFRIPRGSQIITVGKQTSQSHEGAFDVSEWVTDAPITQAVFHWLEDITGFRSSVEESTNVKASVYMSIGFHGFTPPSASGILAQIGNSLRVFTDWFGKLPNDNLSVLVQTQGAADSLPGVVYVPPVLVTGYTSVAVQAVTRAGEGMNALKRPIVQPTATTALDEAFPMMMARQWWGNAVTPDSFHDVWLPAGLANFSASLYDGAANNGEFMDHWDKAREALLVSARYGVANNAGPVWMGVLNDVDKTPVASFSLNTFKGAFVIQMLRSMFRSPQTGDREFEAMIQDFYRRYSSHGVSTEDFKATVEQHMTPAMDLDGNHRMNWFFNEWLNTTDIPSYRLDYSLKPDGKGSTLLEAKLTQSGVSQGFKMLVPVFGEFAGGKELIAVAAMRGSATEEFKLTLHAQPKHLLLNINHDILTEKDQVSVAK